MNVKIWLISATALFLAVAPLSAAAGPCDAYFTFDDTLADASGNGYDGEMIAKGGELSTPAYTEGKFGKALMLDGNAAMRALLDLHWDGCPQVTISAWINVSRGAPNDSMRVLSTGGGNGPGLTISGTGLNLRGTGNGISQQQAIRQGSWIFVAGVYDYAAEEYFLYGGGRTPTPGKLSERIYEPQNAIWVGTEHDDWGVFARGVAIDDLRITGRRLEEPQIAALRSTQPNNADAATGNTGESVAGGSTQGASTPNACDAQSNCPDGNYCAVDNICYSNSQLPRDYVAATAPTGGRDLPEVGVLVPSTTPDADDLLPGSGDGATDSGSGGSSPRPGLPNPNSGPADDLAAGLGDGDTTSDSGGSAPRPGLPNPNSGPADDLAPDVSAGQVMAGRWVHFGQGLGGTSDPRPLSTLDILGRDNGLSGTVTASTFGNDIVDPLTSISKIGRTFSFSSEYHGSWTGQVSQNGRNMDLRPTGLDSPIRRFEKQDEAVPEPDAVADTKYIMLDYDTSVLAYSGVSGGVGDREEQAIFTARRRLPYWIETRENYDKPCTVYVHARDVSSAATDAPYVVEYDFCEGGLLPRINPITTISRALRNPNAGDFQPMTGIEVCNNGINNRVKGIRARVRGITMPGGRYEPSYNTVTFEERTNCVSWKGMAHCSANTFAIGLRLHFRDGDLGSPRDFLSGLELICADVRWMESDSISGPWEPMQ